MSTLIQIKRGPTDPSGITTGEFAYNTTDSKLFIGGTADQKWIAGEVTGGTDMGAGSAASQNRVPTQNAVYQYTRNNFVGSFNGLTGAVTGASLGANTFTGLQTFTTGVSAAGGITLNGAVTGATATFSRLVTFNGGLSAGGATIGTAGIGAIVNPLDSTSRIVLNEEHDSAPSIDIKSPYGYVRLGDPDEEYQGQSVVIDNFNGTVDISGNVYNSGAITTTGLVTGQMGVAIGAGAISAKTGGYTLNAGDNGKVITFTNKDDMVVGINASTGATGYTCTIIQLETGSVRFAGSGVTLNSYNGLTLAGQHAVARVVCYATKTYNISGDTVA